MFRKILFYITKKELLALAMSLFQKNHHSKLLLCRY